MRQYAYLSSTQWEENNMSYLKKAKLIYDTLFSTVEFRNIDLDAKHKSIYGFYQTYMNSLRPDLYNKSDNGLFLSRVRAIDHTMKNDENYVMDTFERAVINLHQADLERNKQISKFKVKFEKEVMSCLDTEIEKNPLVIECNETLK